MAIKLVCPTASTPPFPSEGPPTLTAFGGAAFALSSRGRACRQASLANSPGHPRCALVVVRKFSRMAPTFGDKPGEYQFWVEREHLDETLEGSRRQRAWYGANKQGLYGLLLENLTPFLLDPRFEFDKTYWLFTRNLRRGPGSGVGGQRGLGALGSSMEMNSGRSTIARSPRAGPYGLFAHRCDEAQHLATDANSFGSVESADELGMAYPLNPWNWRQWAFNRTRRCRPFSPIRRSSRNNNVKLWKGYPKRTATAPSVLLGENLGIGPLLARPAPHAMGARELGEAMDPRGGAPSP